jgi:hypothetical protein
MSEIFKFGPVEVFFYFLFSQRVLLQFMKISLPTSQVSINMSKETNLEVMPLRLLDGVLKRVLSIGWSPTPGMRIGEIMVSSRS